MAFCSEPAWRLLAGRHEARLSGRRFLDADEVTPEDRAKAAWLYAQFVTSKTVDVKKSHVGLTFIRQSTLDHQSFTDRAPKLGGLVEFYRSPARLQWSPTGTNVPDYPKLAQLWWQAIGDASSVQRLRREAMDSLCAEQEKVLERLERAGVQGDIGPKLAEEKTLEEWNADAVAKGNLAPQLKIENEKDSDDRQLRRTGQELAEVIRIIL